MRLATEYDAFLANHVPHCSLCKSAISTKAMCITGEWIETGDYGSERLWKARRRTLRRR